MYGTDCGIPPYPPFPDRLEFGLLVFEVDCANCACCCGGVGYRALGSYSSCGEAGYCWLLKACESTDCDCP